jgi:hypothetical protein
VRKEVKNMFLDFLAVDFSARGDNVSRIFDRCSKMPENFSRTRSGVLCWAALEASNRWHKKGVAMAKKFPSEIINKSSIKITTGND